MELKIKSLSKNYGSNKALDQVNLTLDHGIYGLLGSNGAGKSTLMKIITGNITEYEGEILCDGENIRKSGRGYRRKLGYMPQQQAVYEDFSLVQYLWYIGSLKMIEKHKLEKEIDEIAEKVNLADVKDRRIGTYSGGMKQRALLGQALLGSPEMLILDEPSAGLDPEERVNMRDLIAEAAEDKTILVSTHIVSDVELISDSVIFLKKGHIVYFGKTADTVNAFGGNEIKKPHRNKNSETGADAMRTPLEDAYLYYMNNSNDKNQDRISQGNRITEEKE